MGEGSGPLAEGGSGVVHTLENKVSAGSQKSSAISEMHSETIKFDRGTLNTYLASLQRGHTPLHVLARLCQLPEKWLLLLPACCGKGS